jgi:hypothetical protein
MSIASGIFELLKADAGVSAVVGGRIFPVLLPEGPTLPAITYQRVGGTSDPTFDSSGYQRLRIQFDVFGAKYKDADAGREAIREALNGASEITLSDGTVLDNANLIQSADYFMEYPRSFRCMSEYYLYFTFSS